MKQKIKNYIDNCLKCITFSPQTDKKEGYLHSPYLKTRHETRFETYHIDYYGAIDKGKSTKRGSSSLPISRRMSPHTPQVVAPSQRYTRSGY